MGYNGYPIELIKLLSEGIDVYIETGTAGGASAHEAAKIFKEVHTIELLPERGIQSEGNITQHYGSSPEVLKSLMPKFANKPNFIFLDAHYSDYSEDTSEKHQCPILQELKYCGFNSVIFIDDARLFMGTPPWPFRENEWPSITNIIFWLENYDEQRHITIIDDVIVCVPPDLKNIVDKYWKDTFYKRYPNAN